MRGDHMHHHLGRLGVEEKQEQAYRGLLRCTRATPHTLAVHLGRDDAEAVESVLNTLVAMGMATADGTDAYRPVAPSTVVARLVERRLKALHEEMRHVSETRDLLESLLREQEFDNGGPYGDAQTDAPLIERLEGLVKVREKLDELSFFCRTELLATQPGGPMTKDNIAAARPLTEQLLRRGVAMRTIVESGAVADLATAAYLQELTTKGVRIRVVERTAERLLIFDRQTALAPIDPNDSTLGAVAVREPGLVGGMISLFDRIWPRAANSTRSSAALRRARASRADCPSWNGRSSPPCRWSTRTRSARARSASPSAPTASTWPRSWAGWTLPTASRRRCWPATAAGSDRPRTRGAGTPGRVSGPGRPRGRAATPSRPAPGPATAFAAPR